MDNYGKKWTKRDNQFMIDNYQKLGMKRTANALKRTTVAVVNQARILGITSRYVSWTKQQRDYLTRYLYAKTPQEMANDLDVPVVTIYKWIRKMRLNPLTKEQHEDVSVMFDNEYTAEEIALATGFNLDALKTWESLRKE